MSEVQMTRRAAIEAMPDNELPAGAKQGLIAAKIDLVRGYPFMGYLIMTCEYIFTKQIETMAATTIPRNTIYINPEFMLKGLKNRKEIAFVIAHEALHVFLNHLGRARDMCYHPSLWNVAADYMINSYLYHLGSDKMEMPAMALYKEIYKNKSADEIYHMLLDEHGGDANKAAAANGAGQVMDDPANDGSQPQQGSGNGQRPFDHISDEQVSEEAKLDNKQKVAAAVAQSGGSEQGTGASDLMRRFEAMISPVIPWQTLLAEYVDTSARQHYTYQRVSRRSTGSVIFPTMTGNHLNLVFGADTSGSMGKEDLESALSELKSIVEGFDSYNLTFLNCDTKAHVIGEYSSEEGDDWHSISKDMVGNGGTDLQDMIHYANDMENEPSVIVIVTDGYFDPSNLDAAVDEIPVFVIITRQGNKELKMENAMIVCMED